MGANFKNQTHTLDSGQARQVLPMKHHNQAC
jgi:hypothetical protein